MSAYSAYSALILRRVRLSGSVGRPISGAQPSCFSLAFIGAHYPKRHKSLGGRASSLDAALLLTLGIAVLPALLSILHFAFFLLPGGSVTLAATK